MTNISLVIINDNAEDYCRKLFDSINPQINEIEIIFIDNCSNDNSLNVVKEFNISKLYVSEHKVINKSQLYNKGLNLASGDYILFSHSDVFFEQNFFKHLLQHLNENIEYNFVNFPQYYVNGELFGHQRLLVDLDRENLQYIQIFQNEQENTDLHFECSESCFMVKKESILESAFDEAYKDSLFEFDVLVNTLKNRGFVTTFSDCAVFHYFIELHEKIKTINYDKKRFISKYFDTQLFKNMEAEMRRQTSKELKIQEVSQWGKELNEIVKIKNDIISDYNEKIILQNKTIFDQEQKLIEISNWNENEIAKLKEDIKQNEECISSLVNNIEKLQENIQYNIFKADHHQKLSEINRHSLIQVENDLKRAMSTKAWKLMCLARRFNEQFVKGTFIEKKKFLKWTKNKLFKKAISKELELAQFSPIKFPLISVYEQEQYKEIASSKLLINQDHIETSYINYKSPPKVDILRFPVIEWDFRWQRPQQISMQFALQGHRVFYFSIDTQEVNVQDADYNLIASHVVCKEVKPNVWWVKLCAYNRLNAYRDTITDPIDLKYLLYSLDFLKNKFGIESTISILDLPYWAPLAFRLKNNKVIYDCMDDHSGFSTNTAHESSKEQQLIETANLVIASSQMLYEKVQGKNKNTALIRNAGEFAHFSTKPSFLAQELVNIKGPVIGYYGAISDWFDIKLIERLAKNNRNWTFILVGDTFGCDTSLTEKLDNVIFTGEKAYSELPQYLYGFDVCLIPFLISNLTLATNPVKVYEYLSAGKPVVSTRLPELELIGDEIISLANTYEEFESAIKKALNNDEEQIKARIHFAQKNTWLSRYNQLENIIENNLHPKVTVVIVTYNNWSFTKQCLESLFKNSCYTNLEVIVVDNASTDETRINLSRILHPKLKLILSPENTGFAGGNLIGCQAATGDYIILLNNDTIVPEGWVERLIKTLKENNHIGMVGPMSNSVGNDQMLDFFIGDPLNGPDQKWLEEFYQQYSGGVRETDLLGFFCVAIKREVYEKVGDLDTGYGLGMFEDDDYCERVKSLGYKLAIVEDAFVYHHGSASFRKLEDEKYRAIFEGNKAYFEKKWNRKWQLPQPPASIFFGAFDRETVIEIISQIKKKVILILGDLNWTVCESRMKQIANHLVTDDRVFLIVYVNQYHEKELVGIRKMGPSIYLTNRLDLFESYIFDAKIYCGNQLSISKEDGCVIIDSQSYVNKELPANPFNKKLHIFSEKDTSKIVSNLRDNLSLKS